MTTAFVTIGQVSLYPLEGKWKKNGAVLLLKEDSTAKLNTANGKVIQGNWSTFLGHNGNNILAIKSDQVSLEYVYSFDSDGGLVLRSTRGSKKYKFIRVNILAINRFVKESDTNYRLGKSQNATKKYQNKLDSDRVTNAVLITGGLLLLDAILGSGSKSTNSNQFSSDYNTNRVMRNWVEQDSYDRNH